MKVRSRVLALSLCLVLAFCLVVPVRAAGAALTAAEIFSAMWSTYLSSVGVSEVFKSAGTMNSLSNPYSQSSFNSVNSRLFDQYQTSIGGNQTLAEWASWALDRMSVGAAPGVGTVFQMSADLVEFFDRYSTYILENVVGVYRDSVTGLFDTAKTWFNNQLAFNPPSHLFLPAIFSAKPTAANLKSQGLVITASTYYGAANTNATAVLPCVVNGGVVFLSGHSGDVVYFCSAGANNASVSVKTLNLSTGVTGVYYNSALSGQTAATGILSFTSLVDAATYYSGYSETDGDTIQLRPKDKYNEGALGIPNVGAQDYAGEAITGALNYPWDDTIGSLADALAHALDWVNDKIRANVDIMDNSVAADPAAEAALGNDPGEYQSLGLGDVFPFCLPFDLYNFFECLAADPVAPSFEVPIEFPPLDLTYTFEIDLSEFNDVAALLRKLELLGFCVALILITRQKMIRG